MFEKAKNFVKRQVEKVRTAMTVKEAQIKGCAHAVLDGTVAEGYVDTGVKILIAVVIGALLLAGLYALFNTTIMPTVTKKVTDLFNYKGK